MCKLATYKAGSKPCQDFKCKHNIFWDKCNKFAPSKETEDAVGFMNCMCLLDEELTLEQIAGMFGLTRERVRQIEETAIRKVCSAILSTSRENFSAHELMLVLKKKLQLDQKKKDKKEREITAYIVSKKRGQKPVYDRVKFQNSI